MPTKKRNSKSPGAGNKKVGANPDGVYFLKLTIYVILGSLWIKITKQGSSLPIPIPVGLLVGLLFTTHEHFMIDKKIEYAVLLMAAVFGFVAPYGLYINL